MNGNKSNNGYIAIGCENEIVCTSKNINLEKLNEFISIPNSWKFGYISYDVKNEFENLPSGNIDQLEFPEIHFFIPKSLFKIEKNTASLVYGDVSLLVNVEEIFLKKKENISNKIKLIPRINKQDISIKNQVCKRRYSTRRDI